MKLPRSVAGVGAGLVILCGSLAALFLLPRITPYEFLSCSPFEGGTQCFGSINPAYWAAFAILIAGAVLFFFGLFGRGFISGPLFMAGMLLSAWGLLGVIFGYLSAQWCMSRPFPLSCLAYHPELDMILILGGAVSIGANGYWWWRNL